MVLGLFEVVRVVVVGGEIWCSSHAREMDTRPSLVNGEHLVFGSRACHGRSRLLAKVTAPGRLIVVSLAPPVRVELALAAWFGLAALVAASAQGWFRHALGCVERCD